MESRPCRVCGELFTPKRQRSSLCSKRCENRSGQPCTACGKPARARGLCGTHYNQEYQPNRHTQKIIVPCGWCGKDCEKEPKRSKGYKARYCSLECRDSHKLSDPMALARLREQARVNIKAAQAAYNGPRAVALRKLKKAARGVKGWGVLVAGVCTRPNCGEYFIRRYAGAGAPSPFCSSKCRRTERQRQRGINDEVRLAIFERDDWRCQIERCLLRSRKIDRDARIPAPASPTVDHILPQSAGGDDEPANLRAAHFICNSARRDRGTVQLALIG